jgi:MFS family permease
MLGSALFVGWSLFSLVSPPLADKFGRKPVLIVNAVAFVVSGTAILLSHSLNLTIGLLFCIGCTIPGFMNVGFLYAQELLSPNQRNAFNCTYAVYDSSANILAVLAYWFFDNNYFWITAV